MAASAFKEYPIKFDEDEQEAKEIATQQCNRSVKRARAGGEEGGSKCAEIVLIIIALCCIIFVVVYIWQFRWEYLGYIILYAIIAIVIIVGIIKKSSLCMLTAMIFFIIVVVLFSIFLVLIIIGVATLDEPISNLIIPIIAGFIGVVLNCIACCSANTLRKEYE